MVLSEKEFSVLKLIQAYRAKGHLISDTNPIKKRKDRKANVELHYFGLDESDLETDFQLVIDDCRIAIVDC